MATVPERLSCPACGARVAVRLAPKRACPECESQRAWEDPADGGRLLVVTREDVAVAEARRAGELAGVSLLRRALPAVPCALAGLLGLAEGFLLVDLLGPRVLRPLAEVHAELTRSATWTLAVGALALVLGSWGLMRIRRSRLYRAWPLLAAGSLGVLAGLAGVLVGGLAANAASGRFGLEHLAMPVLTESADASPSVRSIMRSTVVILAPDEDGDARSLAIGTGAVIGWEPGRAWIVTCRHVAMPSVAVGSFRDPAGSPAVWVYLADGRQGPGRVAWAAEPPLDVAVVTFDVEDPPPAVRATAGAEDVHVDDGVMLVPNPMRRGWLVHHGSVSRREPHATPAGRYSLLYTDLPLQPGDSGSGLFDAEGRLVGINTWGRADTHAPAGISLPSEALQAVRARLGGSGVGSGAAGGERR